MSSWAQQMARLKETYVLNWGDKLDVLRSLLRPLESGMIDRGALAELRHRFHQLAGSGASYDMPRVSELAREAERICESSLGTDTPVGAAGVSRIGELIGALSIEFSCARPSTVARGAESVRDATSTRPSVLVVDDDSDLTGLLRCVLESNGMRVRVAESAAEARACLVEEMPDAALVDIVLPDGSGYALVEHLRGLRGGESPVVLCVTNLPGFLDKVEAIRSGADGYFEKPLDPKALVQRLHALLERSADEPMRVLVVEDDPDQATLVASLLARADFVVHVCSDPERFETALNSFRPELVILDIGLPGVSGFELARFLRLHACYASLPVLFLTSRDGSDARIQGVEAGGDELLTKPVSPDVLVATSAARIKRAREMATLVSRDGLTGLLTRAAFRERAEAVCSDARRRPERARALVLVDLDDFKSINDQYGHGAGDNALASLGALLRRRLRTSDIIGRLGGDEFAIIIEDLAEPQAVVLVSRLLDEFRRTVQRTPDGAEFRTSFSAGVASLDPLDADVDTWSRVADQALYKAKNLGRGRVVGATAA